MHTFKVTNLVEVLKKRRKTQLISSISILLLLLPCFLLGQEFDYKIKQFGLEDGLSQVSSNALLRDNSGFIWIATQDGLNKFDGKMFKHFKYNASDSLSISGNLTNRLLEDKTGKIWVGTIGNGLNYYDKKSERFHRVSLESSKNENEIISGLEKHHNGTIWVASRVSGLHKLTPIENGSFSQSNFFPKRALSAIMLGKNDYLWTGDLNGTVTKLNSNATNPNNPIITLTLEGQILSFYETDNELLIGSDYGMFIYNFQTKKVKLFELEKDDKFPTKFVSCFLKAKDGKVWIGTGSGLYLFDPVSKKVIRRIEYKGNSNEGLSNNTVQALLRISDTKILVGTANYLNVLDFGKLHFKNISKDKRGRHLLNDNVIFSIFKDDNDLWIGTSDGGLNLIRNGTPYYFNENQNDPLSITGAVVRAIVKDSENQRLWLATTRGLNMIDLKTFDPNNPKFTVFHHDPNDPNTINGDFLKDIALDKDNNVWGGTYGQGIFKLIMSKRHTIEITRFKNESYNSNSLKNDFVQCIEVDKNNTIWIGTQGGLTALKSTENKTEFTNYFKSTNSKRPLSHNSVYDILIDKQNRIWLGTRHGLNLFLGNNEFESWTEQKQFPNAVVYSVQNDETDNLWLGTNEGIIKFDPSEESFTQYNVEDGIQSKEFDIHARYRDSDGTIYLGGIAGVTYFHPNNLKNIDTPKTLYFSQLRVKDEIITPKDNDQSFLIHTLSETKNLKFKHNEFPFYLQFSSIDYRLQKNVSYAYKLLPSDVNWNPLKDPEIQFLNLAPGDYTLLVNGFSRGKEWNQPPLEIKISIAPPWWTTWWAYISYVLILGILSYSFYQFQLDKKMALAESTRLRDINQLRNSLYTNITHEFRTPLTVILGMADTLKTNLNENELGEAENSIAMIKRNGGNLLQLINELLDLAKLESGTMELQLVQLDIVPFVKYLSESFHSLTEEKHINLTVYSEIDTLEMDVDTNKITSIITNLLSNAIKFTSESGEIVVHLNRISKNNSPYFMIKVKDDGFGLSETDLPNIFDRFYQVDASTSRLEEGTGIGLSLVKEFVELMGGTISVKSTLGNGSTFHIQLPITNTAIAISDTDSNIEKTFTHHFDAQNKFNRQHLQDPDSKLPLALLIEDNKDVAYYLKTCLKEKYQTIHAINGAIGIKMAYNRIPDIIISDVMMPEKNGYEVCSILKTDERTDHIPIILLTAKATVKDRITGLSHGADAYLAKPFIKEELFTRLDQLVLLRKKLLQKFHKDNYNELLVEKGTTPEAKFLQKITKIITNEMNNSNFGTAQLAFKLNLSESQVYRKLKAITDVSTAVHIRSIRLQKAKELLQTTQRTISEVGYDVGFNNPSWFSRAFKDEFGFPPSDLTKSLKNNMP